VAVVEYCRGDPYPRLGSYKRHVRNRRTSPAAFQTVTGKVTINMPFGLDRPMARDWKRRDRIFDVCRRAHPTGISDHGDGDDHAEQRRSGWDVFRNGGECCATVTFTIVRIVLER